jgi:hypothetical protein
MANSRFIGKRDHVRSPFGSALNCVLHRSSVSSENGLRGGVPEGAQLFVSGAYKSA